jgi:hypothetical protein
MACADARSRGAGEPTLDVFLRAEHERPFRVRLRDLRKESGERLYQRAALHYAGGNYPALAACLYLAACLNPGHVIPRLYDRKIAPTLEKSLPGKSPVPMPILGGKEACRHAPGT